MTCYRPFQVSLLGKSLTQEHSSKFLLTQSGILCRVMRRTLPRRFARERDREHTVGRCATLIEQVGDAVGERARLAAASACQD